MSRVYIRFPKTGLGNLLLVWARGVVFAKRNDLNYYSSSWWGLRWGAIIRGEQKRRLYWGYFIETPLIKQIILSITYHFGKTIIEPPLHIISPKTEKEYGPVYVFNKVISEDDLFGQLRDHQSLIAAELEKIISPGIKKLLLKYQQPVVGVHIRRGDFKMGNPITPNEYFIKGINLIRSVAGCNLPVTVFTDATKKEIEDILLLPEVFLAEEKPDIVDIILLSKSKIMLLSQSSTFSYWGAFLSEAIVIRPSNDWQFLIKNNNNESGYFEIKWGHNDDNSTMRLKEELVNLKIKGN